MKPLGGLLVLDLTRLLPGGVATLLLANFGAEVIKIEQPGRGDYARSMPPLIDGMGAVFRLIQRGKKSCVLDLKSARGKEAFLRLAAQADVVIESFRPGVTARLGIDYPTLRAVQPRLIYAALTGYGQRGPYAALAGHDINYQALAGALDLTGSAQGAPAMPGVQIADLAGGAFQAVIGILLALAARQRSGVGQMVDVSMLEGVLSMLPIPLAHFAATGQAPERGGSVLTGRYACYHLYPAADGGWLAVGALEPKFWAALCQALDCGEFIADQFAEGPRRQEIIDAVARRFRARSAQEWFERLREIEACVTPVGSVAEVARHLALGAGETVISPRLESTPGSLGPPAPRLGEHTREVLARVGYAEADLADFAGIEPDTLFR